MIDNFNHTGHTPFNLPDPSNCQPLVRTREQSLPVGRGPLFRIQSPHHLKIQTGQKLHHRHRHRPEVGQDAIHDNDPAPIFHRGDDVLNDLDTDVVWPVVEDVLEKVDRCALDRLRGEEIVRLEFDARLQGFGDRCLKVRPEVLKILYNEAQLWVAFSYLHGYVSGRAADLWYLTSDANHGPARN